jgi:Fic family protein
MKFNPNFRITPKLTNQLLEIERHKEALSVLPVTATLIASLRETARLLSTHYSTQIEGNALSPKEVAEVAKGKQGFQGRERDEREVRNYFLALEYIEEAISKKSPFSEKLIQTTHSLVLTGNKRATPYREGQNVIRDGSNGRIVYMPPEAYDVASLMKELTAWAKLQIDKKELPAPILAGLIHYQFATIHPYYDGNGRTARLLTTFVLHQMGYGMKGIYSLEEYYAKNLQGYYKALSIGKSHNYYGGRAEADVTPFLNYFLEGMGISFRSVRQQAERMQSLETTPITDQSDKLRELRPQQRQLLSLFSKQKEVSIQEIAMHLGIKPRSAYSLTQKWIGQGFIQIENPSRKVRTYVLTQEWELLIEGSIS